MDDFADGLLDVLVVFSLPPLLRPSSPFAIK
jgi:hypothetical protein